MSDTAHSTPVPNSGAQSPNSSQEPSSAIPSTLEGHAANSTSSTSPEKPADEGSSDPTASVSSVTESLSSLTVRDPESASTPTPAPDHPVGDGKKSEASKEPEEELSPEEAKLRAKGLKSTHRPGFYVHIDSPRRLRIQTKEKSFDLDRYCPHANADLLKWVRATRDLSKARDQLIAACWLISFCPSQCRRESSVPI
ncbi:hypothetical protein B0O80DRAFT_232089 [Mortierella sp. GBAus27b]|nr:hypothetical protein B0O80DRAFT_232089 [Mortierella sp. GBAus27b]